MDPHGLYDVDKFADLDNNLNFFAVQNDLLPEANR
jgi:hypothetical protein